MLTNRARASRVTDVSEGETYKEKGVPGSRPLTASALGTLSLSLTFLPLGILH